MRCTVFYIRPTPRKGTDALDALTNSTGSKMTLIGRLQEYDKEHANQGPSQTQEQPVVVNQQVRHASTIIETPKILQTATEVPGIPSSSEPSPIPPSYPVEFLDVKLPDTNVPIPEVPAPIVRDPSMRHLH